MIKDISFSEKENATVVTLLEGFKHKFEDNDQVIIKEVLGMTKSESSINNMVTTIKVINP
jgi:Ubiquitin-activating enzyme E1 FCCH domain